MNAFQPTRREATQCATVRKVCGTGGLLDTAPRSCNGAAGEVQWLSNEMTLETLITDYGYWAILVGTFFEGETILVLGGLAAHLGYLELPWVIASGFAGSLFGDQLYFFLGRRHGQAQLQKRPRWQAPAERVLRLLQRHQNWLILGFRFLYGLRTVTPFAIGMSAVTATRFLVLNAVGALAWAVAVGTLGFLFGRTFELLIGKIKHYEIEVMAGIVIVGFTFWTLHFLRRRRRASSGTRPPRNSAK